MCFGILTDVSSASVVAVFVTSPKQFIFLGNKLALNSRPTLQIITVLLAILFGTVGMLWSFAMSSSFGPVCTGMIAKVPFDTIGISGHVPALEQWFFRYRSKLRARLSIFPSPAFIAKIAAPLRLPMTVPLNFLWCCIMLANHLHKLPA